MFEQFCMWNFPLVVSLSHSSIHFLSQTMASRHRWSVTQLTASVKHFSNMHKTSKSPWSENISLIFSGIEAPVAFCGVSTDARVSDNSNSRTTITHTGANSNSPIIHTDRGFQIAACCLERERESVPLRR